MSRLADRARGFPGAGVLPAQGGAQGVVEAHHLRAGGSVLAFEAAQVGAQRDLVVRRQVAAALLQLAGTLLTAAVQASKLPFQPFPPAGGVRQCGATLLCLARRD